MTKTVTAPRLEHIGFENLFLKIAESEAEIQAAQRLRYDVFYREMGAVSVRDMARLERDYDEYDPVCEHLLLIDKNVSGDKNVIGTYRMLRQKTVESANIPFYTETEFDLTRLRAQNSNIMEISRSCIHPSYRGKHAINLLWRGIAAYVFGYNVDYLIGVPSFHGTDLHHEERNLGYLRTFHTAPEDIRPRTLEPHYVPLPEIPSDRFDRKHDFMQLPPLIKGYLRVGAVIGDGAFIDRQFNCIDVCMVMPIKGVADRYLRHYTRDA